MATGETRTIDSDLTLTNKYEMTKNDDILNIIGAIITLAKPAGDLFTNEGNDTVNITNSTITASAEGLSFMLGSGDDTLNIQNSTIDAPILTGSGNDIVVITGDKQSKVILTDQDDAEDFTLNLGSNDDILELQAILEGDGDISFGTGNDTLRFNGGSLLTTGTLGTFTILDILVAGGSLGRDLTLAGENTQIILNGALFGTETGKVITIADSTTMLTTDDNIRTDVTLNLSNVNLTQSDSGTLEFSGHTGYAITANNSTVTLHDIATQTGQVFSGENTDWTIRDSHFSNSTNGIFLTSGSLNMNNIGMSNYTERAINLSKTKLTGAKLAFTNNIGNVAINVLSLDLEINDFQMKGNIVSAIASSNDQKSNTGAFAKATTYANGGGICQESGNLILTTADISGNIAIATSDAWAFIYAIGATAEATSIAYAYANGGGINNISGNLILSSANISDNIVSADAKTRNYYKNSKNVATAPTNSYATAYANGGGIYQTAGTLSLKDTIFSGNVASAVADFGYTGAARVDFPLAYACGGGIFASGAILNISNSSFKNNTACAYVKKGTKIALGGAIYLSDSTMSYTVTSGKEIENIGNLAEKGGFLYIEHNSTANLLVEDGAILTIGDDTNNDSIEGDGLIQKQGNGYLLINSNVSGYTGLWTVYGGTLELARIARTITLDNWTFGENVFVILSNQDDTVNMNMDKTIGILDLGGGSDVINTNGYLLSNGELRVGELKFTGGGQIASTITNRDKDSGFNLTLDAITISSDIIGGVLDDKITVTQESVLKGLYVATFSSFKIT